MVESRPLGINRRVRGSPDASGSGANSSILWVYILQNPQGKFYIGLTNDLPNRLHSHNRTDKLNALYRTEFVRRGSLGSTDQILITRVDLPGESANGLAWRRASRGP